MAHYGFERNGLGNIRVQTHGRRQVVLINWTGILKLAANHGLVRDETEEVPEFIERCLAVFDESDLDSEDVLNNTYYHDMHASEMMAIPMGYSSVERTVVETAGAGQASAAKQEKQALVVGLRVHYLEGPGSNGYKCLQAMCASQEHAKIDKNQTHQYWKTVLAAMTPWVVDFEGGDFGCQLAPKLHVCVM